MMSASLLSVVLFSASLATAPATKPASPPSAPPDPRVQTLAYVPGQVVKLETCVGFQSLIQFADKERIENVALGEATLWQATPNKRGNLIFVKPFQTPAHTNMSVVTNLRTYNFDLKARDTQACQRGNGLYSLNFTYPDEPVHTEPNTSLVPDSPGLPEKRNTAYTYTGERTLVPLRMFDDGQATYLMWAEGVAFPAIYALSDGKESLVNYGYRGGYIIIEQTGPAFVLRRGELAAVLYNDRFVPPALDTLSPQPRTAPPPPREPVKPRSGLFGRKEN
ncbi:MAG: TrbG/VirB9 family P-type conjugative transfer protein [Asticcacaulis sp.]